MRVLVRGIDQEWGGQKTHTSANDVLLVLMDTKRSKTNF